MRRLSILILLIALVTPLWAQPASVPRAGSAERKAILDAIRPRTEKDLGFKVKFEVSHIKSTGTFAFVIARPIHTNGKQIDWRKTKYAQDWKDGVFGDAVLSLLKKSGKTWRILEWSIGASDFPAEDWCKDHKAPKTILP